MVKLAGDERSHRGEGCAAVLGSVGIVVAHKFMEPMTERDVEFRNEWTVLVHGIMIYVDDWDIKVRRVEVLHETTTR